MSLSAPITTDSSCRLEDMLAYSSPHVLVISHRGHWHRAPENSIAAVEAAIEAGADMVEIDAQSTADGTLVVIHDDALDRTTDRTGIVSILPARAVLGARLRTGAGGPDAAVTAEPLPTLEEVLELARGRVALNVDVKFPRDLPAVADCIQRLGMADQVLVKGTVDFADPLAAQRNPFFRAVPYMPMMSARPGRFAADLATIEALAPEMVEVDFKSIDDIVSARAELRRQNCRLWINTLDVAHSLDFSDARALSEPEAVWGRLIAAGVGAIQTDEVDALVAFLRQRGLAR